MAYDEHALRVFEVHAVDYLLKPFRAERFDAALERANVERDGHSGCWSGRRHCCSDTDTLNKAKA